MRFVKQLLTAAGHGIVRWRVADCTTWAAHMAAHPNVCATDVVVIAVRVGFVRVPAHGHCLVPHRAAVARSDWARATTHTGHMHAHMVLVGA